MVQGDLRLWGWSRWAGDEFAGAGGRWGVSRVRSWRIWIMRWSSTLPPMQPRAKSAERVIGALDRYVGRENFYVAVSRVKRELRLYASEELEGVG